MSGTEGESSTSANSWKGEVFAGIIRTKNWTGELTVSDREMVVTGPMGMRHVLTVSQVGEVRVAVGRFLFWSWRLKNTISISHNNDQVPSKMAFRSWSTPAPEMLDRLQALGYQVS